MQAGSIKNEQNPFDWSLNWFRFLIFGVCEDAAWSRNVWVVFCRHGRTLSIVFRFPFSTNECFAEVCPLCGQRFIQRINIYYSITGDRLLEQEFVTVCGIDCLRSLKFVAVHDGEHWLNRPGSAACASLTVSSLYKEKLYWIQEFQWCQQLNQQRGASYCLADEWIGVRTIGNGKQWRSLQSVALPSRICTNHCIRKTPRILREN